MSPADFAVSYWFYRTLERQKRQESRTEMHGGYTEPARTCLGRLPTMTLLGALCSLRVSRRLEHETIPADTIRRFLSLSGDPADALGQGCVIPGSPRGRTEHASVPVGRRALQKTNQNVQWLTCGNEIHERRTQRKVQRAKRESVPQQEGSMLHHGYLARFSLVLLSMLCLASTSPGQISFVEPSVAPPIFFSPPGNGQESVIGVARGDFNGDGFLDLAVTKDGGVGGASVMVMLGNGNGTFQGPITMSLPSGMNIGMLLAKDFDEDGKLDLMVVVSGHQVFFYKGMGDGTFAAPVAINTVGSPISIQAADLNADGHLDLVAANNPEGTVTVLLGKGDGTFQSPAVYAITGSNNPNDLAIGDIDRVNGPDIVVGVYNSHCIEVLLNKGDGTFPSASTSINARLGVRGLYLADFDSDGKLDVLVAGDGVELGVPVSAIGFMKGNGDGTFQNPPDGNFQAVESSPERRFTENVAPDLNGDGFPDVVVTHAGTNFVTVCLNHGDGHFDVQEWVASPGPGFSMDSFGNIPLADGNRPLSVVAGDFNGDGLLDLAVASGAGDRPGGLSILLGTGLTGGSFVAALASQLSSHPGGTAGVFGEAGQYFVALGDFNNDRNVDAVAVTTSPSTGGSLDFLAGRGDGTFSSPVQMIVGGGCPADDTTPFGPPIRAGDINQDGNLDIAMVGSLNIPLSIHCVSGISVGYGNGDGTFNFFAASARSDWQGFVVQNLVLGDFNGDGKLDLAVLRWNTQTTLLEVYLWPFNTHTEMIDGQARTVLDVSYSAVVRNPRIQWAIVAGDFNGDGLLDLVAHSDADGGGPEGLVFLQGNGDGTFTQSTQTNVGFFNILDFKTADLNSDGKLDLVASSGRAVYVALGNGNGTFQPPVVYDLAPQSLVPRGAPADIVDLDGDGHLDVIVAMVGAGLAVLPGNGDGTFGTVRRFAVGNSQSLNVNVADLNGDAKPDLVVGRNNSSDLNFLTVLINNSSAPSAALRKLF